MFRSAGTLRWYHRLSLGRPAFSSLRRRLSHPAWPATDRSSGATDPAALFVRLRRSARPTHFDEGCSPALLEDIQAFLESSQNPFGESRILKMAAVGELPDDISLHLDVFAGFHNFPVDVI